jgi:protein TonB
MYADIYNEKNDIIYIIKVSFFFHFAIIATLLLIVWLRPEKERPPPIPFFEMVNVMPPPPQPAAKQPKPTPPEPAPPEPAPPEPAPAKPEPAIKPAAKPEPAPAKQQPKPVAPEPAPPPEPSMDMPMDMPKDIKKPDMDMPALRTLGSVIMDPQMEAYLKTLHKLIYQNFNPPSGTAIAKGTKSSIQFQIARNGEISEVILRSSSGNSIWDRLASRAVQITKPPPLPPSYDAEILPLILDFREK